MIKISITCIFLIAQINATILLVLFIIRIKELWIVTFS